jgi:hypothetical protein
MIGMTRRLFPLVTALMLSLWLAGCAGESQADAEGGEAAGEHAAMEAAMEAAGEHAEGVADAVNAEGSGEHQAAGEHAGEHAEGGEHAGEAAHNEEGEESGVYIGAAESWDVVRGGARLVLAFDPAAKAFVGTVENTTQEKLCAIRVEVHLSTGIELGPTAQADLPAGQTIAVTLPTEGGAFETWTAHPEMSPCGVR